MFYVYDWIPRVERHTSSSNSVPVMPEFDSAAKEIDYPSSNGMLSDVFTATPELLHPQYYELKALVGKQNDEKSYSEPTSFPVAIPAVDNSNFNEKKIMEIRGAFLKMGKSIKQVAEEIFVEKQKEKGSPAEDPISKKAKIEAKVRIEYDKLMQELSFNTPYYFFKEEPPRITIESIRKKVKRSITQITTGVALAKLPSRSGYVNDNYGNAIPSDCLDHTEKHEPAKKKRRVILEEESYSLLDATKLNKQEMSQTASKEDAASCRISFRWTSDELGKIHAHFEAGWSVDEIIRKVDFPNRAPRSILKKVRSEFESYQAHKAYQYLLIASKIE